jgi:hypothetical protein
VEAPEPLVVCQERDKEEERAREGGGRLAGAVALRSSSPSSPPACYTMPLEGRVRRGDRVIRGRSSICRQGARFGTMGLAYLRRRDLDMARPLDMAATS